MPNYNYECESCEMIWDEIHPMSKRDTPTNKPCPHCGKKKTVKKSWKDCTPGLGVDHTLTPDKATGGRWSELMTRMKKGLTKSGQRKMDKHQNAKGTRWH